MKMGSRMEPVEHAFMGGLAGFAAFVILDVGWFVMKTIEPHQGASHPSCSACRSWHSAAPSCSPWTPCS